MKKQTDGKLKSFSILLLIACSLSFIIIFAIYHLQFAEKDTRTFVKFASWGSQSEVAIIKPILAEFEKENPDIKVDFVHVPQNYFQKLHLLFASNLAPDVVFINNLYLPVYANAGVLEELKNPTVEKSISLAIPKENRSSVRPFTASPFYDKALKALSYDGKLYAIPRDVSNLVVYYNKDLFNRYNVPAPSKYWTFNDFLILAQKLTKDTNNDGKTDIWGISFEKDLFFYLPFLMSEGGGVLSDDLKTQIFNSNESQKGLKFYADLRNKYHVAPTDSQSASATMAQLFLQEKLAMQISGRWLVPKFRKEAKFDWNVVNFPRGDKGSIVPLDASGWAITKSSMHKEEAIRLIEFLASKKSIEKFTRSGLIVPARKDIAKEFSLEGGLPQNAEVFIDVIKTSKPTPVSVNYNEIQDDLKTKTNYLFNGE